MLLQIAEHGQTFDYLQAGHCQQPVLDRHYVVFLSDKGTHKSCVCAREGASIIHDRSSTIA